MRDMEDKEKKLELEINRGLRGLTLDDDSYTTGGGVIKFDGDEFGLCSDCKYLYAARTEYGTVIGKCFELNIMIRGIDKIKECTMYDKKGSMSLQDMKEIAIIIEVDKNRVGFV